MNFESYVNLKLIQLTILDNSKLILTYYSKLQLICFYILERVYFTFKI